MSRVEKLYDLVGGNNPTIVYVDPAGVPGTNCDFIDIPSAAAYLRALPEQRGGIIAIKSGVTYNISVVVDIRGLTIKAVGDGATPPVINAVTGGVLRTGGTTLDGVTVIIPAGFAGTYFLDTFESASNIFRGCDFRPATGKYAFGSSGGPFSVNLTFYDCGQGNQNGAMVDAAAIFASTNFIVIGTNAQGKMKFGAWTIFTSTEGRADSTSMGSYLNAYFVVAPGENIQARLNAIAALGGGMCVLLSGVHQVSTSIIIVSNNTVLKGMGKSTIVRAVAPWVGGVTIWDAVVMIGNKATATVVNRSSVENIKVEQQTVGPHGFSSYGGDDNLFHQCTAEAQSDMRFVATGTFWTGFWMTDSTGAPTNRPMIRYCLVTSNMVGNNMYCDGFHMEGVSTGGNFGHNNRVRDGSVFLSSVNRCDQSVFIFTGCDGSGIFENRGRNTPTDPNGVVVGIINCFDIQVVGNSIMECPAAGAGALPYYIDSSQRITCIGNSINGVSNNYGVGFALWYSGFWVGVYSSRIIVSHNTMRRCTTGIRVYNANSTENVFEPNTYDTVTTRIVDASILNRICGVARRGTGNPNGVVSGNFGDLFFDTATSTQYICTSYPQGTVWQVI